MSHVLLSDNLKSSYISLFSASFASHLWDFIFLVYCFRLHRVSVRFVLFDLVFTWNFFALAVFLSSNSFLSVSLKQSWCLQLDLPKTLRVVSYIVASKELQFSSAISDSWYYNPANVLSISFLWCSLRLKIVFVMTKHRAKSQKFTVSVSIPNSMRANHTCPFVHLLSNPGIEVTGIISTRNRTLCSTSLRLL